MAPDVETFDAATVSRVSRNIDLLHRYTLTLFEEPSLLDEIPNGGEIVFIPDDDPELAESNLRSTTRRRGSRTEPRLAAGSLTTAGRQHPPPTAAAEGSTMSPNTC